MNFFVCVVGDTDFETRSTAVELLTPRALTGLVEVVRGPHGYTRTEVRRSANDGHRTDLLTAALSRLSTQLAIERSKGNSCVGIVIAADQEPDFVEVVSERRHELGAPVVLLAKTYRSVDPDDFSIYLRETRQIGYALPKESVVPS